MVQVQSTWFPIYDRNPQRFVPNIFEADEGDYQKTVQRVSKPRQSQRRVVAGGEAGLNPVAGHAFRNRL